MIMIDQSKQKNQLPKEIQPAFKELKLLHILETLVLKSDLTLLVRTYFKLCLFWYFTIKIGFNYSKVPKEKCFPAKMPSLYILL